MTFIIRHFLKRDSLLRSLDLNCFNCPIFLTAIQKSNHYFKASEAILSQKKAKDRRLDKFALTKNLIL